jgi:crossover junction endodeoxyribonuclease RuvC
VRGRLTSWPCRIVGIDPGTVRLGYGIIDVLGPVAVRYVECGTITGRAGDSRARRLLEIASGLRELFLEARPSAIAMEEAFFGHNPQSTLALGEARGVVMAVAGESGLSIWGYSPATVKKAVVGHGRATKEQIGYLVRATFKLRRVPAPDAADGLAIALCHARNLGGAPPS